MDYGRKNNLTSERGVALLTSLMIAIGAGLLIAGIYYVLKGTIKISNISRQFNSAQEAAFGGIEHGAAIVDRVISYGYEDFPSNLRSGLGILSSPEDLESLRMCKPNVLVKAAEHVPDGFDLNITIQCINYSLIPGSSESLVFPPPPGGSGSGGNKAFYVFYSIRAVAKDNVNNIVSDVEALYRIAR